MGMSLCLGFLPLVEIPFFSRTAGDEIFESRASHVQVTNKSRTSHVQVTTDFDHERQSCDASN
jgi:hypothetical protein